MQSVDLLKDNPDPSEAEIRAGIEGNLCRCTGYQNIVRAVRAAAVPAAAARRHQRRRCRMTAVDEAVTPGQEFGRARRRKEDQRLITGRTRWTDNITLPGMVHLAMVRSTVAHGTVTGLDVVRREGRPGRRSGCGRARTSTPSRAACRARGRSPPT